MPDNKNQEQNIFQKINKREMVLRVLESSTKLQENSLTGEERLSDLEHWDSLAALDIVLSVEKLFGVTLELEGLARCSVVNDLVALALGVAEDVHDRDSVFQQVLN